MLVQSSIILERVEITMSTFESHVLQEVCRAGQRAVTRMIARVSIWPRPFIEHVVTTHAYVYLDTAIFI